MGTKRTYEKSQMDKQHPKRRSQEGPEAKIPPIPSEQYSIKYRIGKRQGIRTYMNTCFKKFISIHDRLAIEINRSVEDMREWMTKGKTSLIQNEL